MSIDAIILLSLIFVFPILTLMFYYQERYQWNRGFSPAGVPWRLAFVDSQGGRMYTDGFGHHCSVSYPFVDQEYGV